MGGRRRREVPTDLLGTRAPRRHRGCAASVVALVLLWTLRRLWVRWEWSSHDIVVCRVVHHAGCLLFSKGTLPQGVARVVVVVRKFGVKFGQPVDWED